MNSFDSLGPPTTCVSSYNSSDTSSDDVNVPSNEQSSCDSEFELPPEFPPGSTVGDLTVHLSNVLSQNPFPKLKAQNLSSMAERNRTHSVMEPAAVCHFNNETQITPRNLTDGLHCADVYNVHRRYSSSTSAPCSLVNGRIHRDLSKSDSLLSSISPLAYNLHSCHSKIQECVDTVEVASDFQFSRTTHVGDDISADANPVPIRDPELYSNSGSDNDGGDFDDFTSFQSVEPEIVRNSEPVQLQNDEFADFSVCQRPTQHSQGIPTPNSLVKNLLVHTQTALEAAFSTDRSSGLEPFVPSQLLSPNDVNAFKAQLCDLWKRASSETVQNLLSSVSSHPESFASHHIWRSSHTYSLYLETIGVDLQSTRFVLPNHGCLKLLEPTPVKDHTPLANPPVAHLTPAANNTATSAPQTPVPEFDWSASGLTNPLSKEHMVQSVSEADLELFEEMPSKTNPKSPASISDNLMDFLELKSSLSLVDSMDTVSIFFTDFNKLQKIPLSDLEVEFLHSVIPPPPMPASNVGSTLHSFEIHTDNPTISTMKEERVPERVSRVLTLLPDFSYLRKSILAFPVLDQTD